MTIDKNRVAIVFPKDAAAGADTRVESTRLAGVAEALAAAGADVVSAPFADPIADEIEGRLFEVDAALVWFNPIEGGRDRSVLNRMLRSVAAKGVLVSAHPDVIDKMGTKDVLYRTRDIGWGTDTRRYGSLDEMQCGLPDVLVAGPRVLKQLRGQSGDGVWKVSLESVRANGTVTMDTPLLVRHAKRGAVEEAMPFGAFLGACEPYFITGGAMIDQPYQPRLHEGMIRCYVVRDRVEGFGEQLLNALYPAAQGRPVSEAPQPGPRLYYSPDRPDLHVLKNKLEREWIPAMNITLGLSPGELPILWDADFLLGPKDRAGADTYVLCEINISSVYPFPPSALDPLVQETMRRLRTAI